MTRIASVRVDGATRAARVGGEAVILLPFADVGELLSSGEDWLARAESLDEGSLNLDQVEFAPVTVAPGKIICVGLNYRDHAREVKLDLPEYPQFFAKYAGALIGAGDEVRLPRVSEKVDWEAELGVVIGSPARHVTQAEASAHIAGYTVANDVSVRDWQRRTSQFLQGKTFEATTPVGPWMTTADEVDPANLRIECAVDGETVQDVSTADMIYAPDYLISYLSQIITLMPGDLIITGTGAGAGMARNPRRYLTPGCTLRTSIEGLGTLENPCVPE